MQTTDFVATLCDAASNPGKVTVTFTMALNALRKGHTATIILMIEAVELGLPNAAAGMDIGKPFRPVAELLAEYLEQGGRIAICSSCLTHHGISADQVDTRFAVITAPDVIDLLMNAKGSLQLS
jgi:predicted peroxiredoxin